MIRLQTKEANRSVMGCDERDQVADPATHTRVPPTARMHIRRSRHRLRADPTRSIRQSPHRRFRSDHYDRQVTDEIRVLGLWTPYAAEWNHPDVSHTSTGWADLTPGSVTLQSPTLPLPNYSPETRPVP